MLLKWLTYFRKIETGSWIIYFETEGVLEFHCNLITLILSVEYFAVLDSIELGNDGEIDHEAISLKIAL